jgi:peptidoglycan/xylan/chitin deacetylase (PgdA/CDA1 family)
MPGSEQLFSLGRARRTIPYRRALLLIVAVLLIALLLAGRSISARGGNVPDGGHPALVAQVIIQPARGSFVATQAPAEPPPMPAPTEPAPTQAPTDAPRLPGYATFMTAEGDTLASIAARMGSDPAAIAALNHLDPQAALRPARPLVIPVFRPGEGGGGGMVIRRGNPAMPEVALTFDIEIDDTSLYAILDVLRARGIHGTFFVTGNWVRSFPDAARAIVRDGHEIGNHSLTHPYFSRIGLDGAAAELEKTEKIIQETTGVTSRPYFRFPYGDSTANTVAIVAREGYVAYHWSADDGAISGWIGWAGQHKAEANGGVLLMHGRSATVQSLPGWLDQLAAMGLKPTTLGEVLR